MKQVNLEEILNQFCGKHRFDSMEKEDVFEAMQEACNQTVDLCAENAKLKCTNDVHPKGYPYFMHNPNGLKEEGDLMITCNKQSILDTKKQII